ncbi:MAG: type III pantothenate kinase [Halieaceae bacterium]|jgi:type III pantothenate kinase|nr:type III pantothenate kinase [Halieaceae bacterium]
MKLAATCLQFDIGNSSAKWRLLRAGEIVSRGSFNPGDLASRQALLDCTVELEQAWVASVAAPETEAALGSMLEQQWGVKAWFARTAAHGAGVTNSYANPDRMGVDRWLAMLAARRHVEGRYCVVDVGSALTIDLVDATGVHEGGYIIPGEALMERALQLDTDRVRFTEQIDFALNPGKSTAEAVRHGIALAQAGAVRLVLERSGVCASGATLFCGGGGEQLMQLLGLDEIWAPDLVFEGLQVMAHDSSH